MTLVISGTGSVRERRQIVLEVARARPRLGSPIELISPAEASHSRGGGLPSRGAQRDRLRHVGGEREALEQRSPNTRRRRDRVEAARAVDHRMAQRAGRRTRSCEQRRVEHGPVDAGPPVPVDRRHHAAVAGAEPARHRRLHRELGRARRGAGARSSTAASIAGGPAGVDRRGPRARARRRAARSRSRGGRREPSSVAIDRLARRARRPGRDARRGSRAAACPPHASCDREQRRDRRCRRRPAGVPRRRRGSRGRAGRRAASPSPASSSHSRCVPGPTSSRKNSTRPSSPVRRTETARRGTAARAPPAPPLGRGQHVELARLGARGRVARTRGPRRARPLGGRATRPGGGRTGALTARVDLLQRDHVGSPSRAARIARAAAWPPESVVMQGIPRATAARRISQPSERAPEPVGVLMTRSTSPEAIASTTCGEPSPTLRSVRTGTPMRAIACAVPRVATISKPRSCSWRGEPGAGGLVGVGHGDEDGAARRQRGARGGLRLGERGLEVAGDPHHLAGRAHLGPEQRVGAVEAVEGQHRLLDGHVAPAHRVGGQVELRRSTRRA